MIRYRSTPRCTSLRVPLCCDDCAQGAPRLLEHGLIRALTWAVAQCGIHTLCFPRSGSGLELRPQPCTRGGVVPTEAYEWETQNPLRDQVTFLEDNSFSTEKHCCKSCGEEGECDSNKAGATHIQTSMAMGNQQGAEGGAWTGGISRDPWQRVKLGGGGGGGGEKKKRHVTTAEMRKKTCGPEVTAWLVDQLIAFGATYSQKAKSIQDYEQGPYLDSLLMTPRRHRGHHRCSVLRRLLNGAQTT